MAGVKETISSLLHMAGTLFWRSNPPPILGGIVPADRPEKYAKRADALVEKTEELEKELARHGIIARRNYHGRD